MGVKITELNQANSVQNTDVLPIVQNGETKKVQVETLGAAKVNKTGDTLTGGLTFNNKNDYDAFRKLRTINNTDYGVSVGVGANTSARIELYQGSTALGGLDVKQDGLYNEVNGKKLAEQETSSAFITASNSTLATNVSYKIGNVVGINAKLTAFSTSAGTGKVIATLDSGYYNSSTETSLVAVINTGTTAVCWIRTNGEIVVSPTATISNAEVRLVGSFIV